MRCRHKTPANAPLPFRTMAQWATSQPLRVHALWIVQCLSLDFLGPNPKRTKIRRRSSGIWVEPLGSTGIHWENRKKVVIESSNPSIVWRIVSMLGISLAFWLASSWAVTLGAQMLYRLRLTYWIRPETAWKHSYYIFLTHKEEPGISRNLLDIAWIFIIHIIHSAKKICTFCRHHPLEGSSSPTH